jgi:DNA-directed RNA polymerase sigma subunit (sigma70/sigma32)
MEKELKMSDPEDRRKRELLRAQVHEILAALTPEEAQALRKRFRIDLSKSDSVSGDADMDALLSEMAAMKNKH